MRLLLFLAAASVMWGQPWQGGQHQIRFFMGSSAVNGAGWTEQPTIGTGYDIAFKRWLGITTGYTWNLLTAESVEHPVDFASRTSLHDIMAGPRFQAPIGRVTPFVAPLGGVVVFTRVTHLDGKKNEDSSAHAAAGAGAGVEINIGRGWSLLTEAKAIRPDSLPWYGHIGFGFTYRTRLWGH